MTVNKRTVRLSAAGEANLRQREFFASQARYTAYGGARGGGKSWALRRKLAAMCLRWPGLRAMLVRRSYGELKGNHLEQMLTEYGAVCRWDERDKTLCFPRGSRIRFGYCDSERDALRYQGQEYDVIAIDEATQLTETQFAAFSACLRGTSPCPRRMYLTCNPGGVGHAWVKRLFVDRDFRVGENPDDYRFIRAQVYDNRVLLEADPGYVRQLEALPETLRAAWLEGRWDVFAGQFFPEFRTERHVFDAYEIPRGWSRFAALDYGFDMLALLLLAVDYSGGVWVLRELCRPNLSLGEAGAEITAFLAGEAVEYAVVSPDLWNRRQDTGRSGVEILSAVPGIPPLRRADDRRVAGWRVVREYLAGDGDGASLHISSVCPTLIHSLSALRFDRLRIEDAADQPHDVTHAPEALRYAVMSRPTAPAAEDTLLLPRRQRGYWL